MNRDLLDDLAAFAVPHVDSGDIDPTYPVLAARLATTPPTDALWHVIVYAAYYDLASAERALAICPHPDRAGLDSILDTFPTGTERRNLRGGKVVRHLDHVLSLAESSGGLRAWLLRDAASGNPLNNWTALRRNASLAWGNGRWASYKLAELCTTVLSWPLAAPDMGMDGASGPLSGLRLLWPNLSHTVRADAALYEAYGARTQHALADRTGRWFPLEQVETILCDFHALADGRYYISHDIDQQLGQLRHVARVNPDITLGPLWDARATAFAPRYLGELGGWDGVDLARCKLYRDRGLILDRSEHATVPAA